LLAEKEREEMLKKKPAPMLPPGSNPMMPKLNQVK
jgi:hypothetical protein